MKKAKKKSSSIWKIVFWISIGWWAYIYKFILIDIPVWIVKKCMSLAKKPTKTTVSNLRPPTPPTYVTPKPQPTQTPTIQRLPVQTAVTPEPPAQAPVAPQAPPRTRNEVFTTLKEAADFYACTGHHSKSNAFECILSNLDPYPITLRDEHVLRQNEILNPYEPKNLTRATNLEDLKMFVAIDTETTGLSPSGNDIIEISAVLFMHFRPAEIFHTYLKPRNPIPPEATNINGITDDMVKDAPTFSQIKSTLEAFVDDFPLVAHNAQFDTKFLHVSGMDLEPHKGRIYDTLALARQKIRDSGGNKLSSYKLEALCGKMDIDCKNYHSATSDALACGLVFVDIIKKMYDTDNIDDILY